VGWADDCREAMASEAFGRESDSRVVGFVDVNIHRRPTRWVRSRTSRAAARRRCGGGGHVRLPPGPRSAKWWMRHSLPVRRCCPFRAPSRSLESNRCWSGAEQAADRVDPPNAQGIAASPKADGGPDGATAALVLLSPIFAVVALAVKLESCGSTIFGHRRVGLNGHSFKCFKFRSMHPDAEKRLRSTTRCTPSTCRTTSSCRRIAIHASPGLAFLRRTSLDELPQLINVLKGEMSLVGPRPIVQEEIDVYGHGAPVFLSLKPGMTGAWQTNGRSDVGYPLRADIELEYVRNWSLGRDLRILFKTFPAVLTRRGAH